MSDTVTAGEVRAWLKEQGVDVRQLGRLREQDIDTYNTAHPERTFPHYTYTYWGASGRKS